MPLYMSLTLNVAGISTFIRTDKQTLQTDFDGDQVLYIHDLYVKYYIFSKHIVRTTTPPSTCYIRNVCIHVLHERIHFWDAILYITLL